MAKPRSAQCVQPTPTADAETSSHRPPRATWVIDWPPWRATAITSRRNSSGNSLGTMLILPVRTTSSQFRSQPNRPPARSTTADRPPCAVPPAAFSPQCSPGSGAYQRVEPTPPTRGTRTHRHTDGNLPLPTTAPTNPTPTTRSTSALLADLGQIGDVLGGEFHADLIDRVAVAARIFDDLVTGRPPVLAHADLQPANVVCDDAGAWLLDLEYAALARWSPACARRRLHGIGDGARL